MRFPIVARDWLGCEKDYLHIDGSAVTTNRASTVSYVTQSYHKLTIRASLRFEKKIEFVENFSKNIDISRFFRTDCTMLWYYRQCLSRVSLWFEKDRQNIDSFRGFIEKYTLFSNRSETLWCASHIIEYFKIHSDQDKSWPISPQGKSIKTYPGQCICWWQWTLFRLAKTPTVSGEKRLQIENGREGDWVGFGEVDSKGVEIVEEEQIEGQCYSLVEGRVSKNPCLLPCHYLFGLYHVNRSSSYLNREQNMRLLSEWKIISYYFSFVLPLCVHSYSCTSPEIIRICCKKKTTTIIRIKNHPPQWLRLEGQHQD